jgi:hypothetical protein
MLPSSGHEARVHSHVPLPRVAVGRPRCVGPAVGTSGGGGLARRATMTFATGAVLAVVPAAITAIAVFVVILRTGCHRCRRCRHEAGETVAWPSGM